MPYRIRYRYRYSSLCSCPINFNILDLLADAKHVLKDDVYTDMEIKETILKWLLNKKIHSYQQVTDIIRRYYYNPTEVYDIARLGEDWKSEET